MKSKVNIKRVVTKVVTAALVLYVGGLVLTEVGLIVENTSSQLYQGFSLIGWTITSTTNATATNCVTDSGGGLSFGSCVTDATTGTGLLTVVGVIAFASIVLEFVSFRL